MRQYHRLLLCLILLPLLLGADELYRAARKDLDAGKWNEAAGKFGQVAQKGGPEADAALYWQAYAQKKAGRSKEALATVRRLASAHPKSPWLDDARALEVEIRGASAPVPDADVDLKLYVLSSLIAKDPGRALPRLQEILRGPHPLPVKEQALFVVSQGETPAARQLLEQVARGAAHPELLAKALEALGNLGDDPARQTLREIYRTSPRTEVKLAALEGSHIAGDHAALLEVARGNQPLPLRRKAIELLGGNEARAELRQLYASESDRELRRHILDALAGAEDVETLSRAAREEKDPDLRLHAIQSLGVSQSRQAVETLRSIYASGDRPARRAVIDAFQAQENARALIEIFRSEKDPELRKHAVHALTTMDSPEAEEFVNKIFEN
ncbi:MAG: HEAT repeat domain-containing protein [Thermoanaerobaculia bacterium]